MCIYIYSLTAVTLVVHVRQFRCPRGVLERCVTVVNELKSEKVQAGRNNTTPHAPKPYAAAQGRHRQGGL